MRVLILLLIISHFTACSHTIYVVRHGEKALPETMHPSMKNDPALSADGNARAEALKETLKNERIGYIFSTNTTRTRKTAEPTRNHFGIDSIRLYAPIPGADFIERVKSLKKNVLIVGHSNTIDDVVNKICGETKIAGDLPETIYDNLYIIRAKGNKTRFENRKYGKPSNE